MAAFKGYDRAQCNLGICYHVGTGVTQSNTNAANSSVSNNSNTFGSTDVSNSNRWRRTATFAMMVVLLQASFIIWQMLYNSNDVDKLAQRINMLQEAVAAQQEGVCNTVQKDL